MRTLTTEETKKVNEIIRNTEWVHEQVNQDLLSGKDWNLVMYEVAKAFKIIERIA